MRGSRAVSVATLVGNLTAQEEATNRLSRGLVDLGFQVVARSWDLDRVLHRSADGVSENIPEEIRKKLHQPYGLQGIFIGTLSQDRGHLISETRLSLRLISVATGKLIWSTNVVGDAVTGLSGAVKDMAIAAVEKALQSLEKDIYPAPMKKPTSLFDPNLEEKSATKIRLKYRAPDPAYHSLFSATLIFASYPLCATMLCVSS